MHPSESKPAPSNNGTLPKFQFAFGQSKATSGGAAQPQTIEAVEVVNGANGQPRQHYVISGSPASNNQGECDSLLIFVYIPTYLFFSLCSFEKRLTS